MNSDATVTPHERGVDMNDTPATHNDQWVSP